MRDLIFWRHAEAEDYSDSGLDTDRALKKRGHKQAAKMAKWLSKNLPINTKVLVSPALRCQQTAAALQEINSVTATTLELLSVHGSPQQMMRELLQNADNTALLVVGHQPNLGFVIASCLGLPDNAVNVKKASVWWLRQSLSNAPPRYLIYTVMLPDSL